MLILSVLSQIPSFRVSPGQHHWSVLCKSLHSSFAALNTQRASILSFWQPVSYFPLVLLLDTSSHLLCLLVAIHPLTCRFSSLETPKLSSVPVLQLTTWIPQAWRFTGLSMPTTALTLHQRFPASPLSVTQPVSLSFFFRVMSQTFRFNLYCKQVSWQNGSKSGMFLVLGKNASQSRF